MPDNSFPKSRRVLKKAEFDRAFRRRVSQADGLIVVYACENGLPYARLGLVVSKKCGNAVERGRWKRCLREAFRLSQRELPARVDLVILPRPAAKADVALLRKSMVDLARRLGRRLEAPASAPRPTESAAPDEAAP